MQVIDDYTSKNVTEFVFSDGSTAQAVQNHATSGTPFVAKGDWSTPKKVAAANWTGCNVVEGWG